MKKSLLSAGLGVLLLAACSNTAIVRGDCEAMMPTERQRCLAANESNRQVVAEQAKAERAARSSRGEFDKEDLEASRNR